MPGKQACVCATVVNVCVLNGNRACRSRRVATRCSCKVCSSIITVPVTARAERASADVLGGGKLLMAKIINDGEHHYVVFNSSRTPIVCA